MPTLLVFLKYPRPGSLKTRLSADVGPQRAATMYREWIGLVLARLQPLRDSTSVIGYFAGAPRESFAPWHDLAGQWWQQPAGDLGGRLEAGFAAGHARGGPVVAVGTDCLELDADLVRSAFDLLGQKDVVFGPALDGGYYLVGTARLLRGFFDGVPWSTAETLARHVEVCRRQQWSAALLPTRRDIDTWSDWLDHRRCTEKKKAM
jgi:rSAM/selenodomain-associated transferase 1